MSKKTENETIVQCTNKTEPDWIIRTSYQQMFPAAREKSMMARLRNDELVNRSEQKAIMIEE